ncbi:ribbon-helix-helix protein, CopG family [Marinilabiliaceae bacterium JC017]|nr:ribbon-helix-helix protein, CopG family [Marinilabiliaceae bacterium JC017]
MAKTPFSLKLDSELMEEVKKQAEKEMRSTNNFIEYVLKKYIEEKKQNPAK